MIYCKPCTDPVSPHDGQRILIGSVLQQDLCSDVLAIDMQLEALAPSNELIQWMAQHADQPEAFRRSYIQQLSTQPEHWLILLDYVRNGNLTLLCGSSSQLFYLEILAGFLEDELENWQEASSPVCYADLNRLN
ncbi:MAG: DUF488 family protein [Moraxellaceae bacterium]|nr:MAG: DUF488 family protein [Moraxellaceae bacterium]